MFFSGITFSHIKIKNPLRVQSHILCHIWKRASLSASEEGSVTVETAIVMPILLCAFMGIMMWGKVFLLQQEIETALLETARQVARQEALLQEKDKEGLGILSAGALFRTNRKQGDGAQGLEVSYISLVQSEYRKDTKEVYLNAKYQVKIPVLLFGTWNLPLQTSVVQKAWNGYTPKRATGSGKAEYVYVTEHGETYHKDSQCYHLHITIRETENVDELYRGESSYRPCEFCVSGGESMEMLYITEEGDCYHEDLACSGLTRTVQYVELGKAGGRRMCADCGSER